MGHVKINFFDVLDENEYLKEKCVKSVFIGVQFWCVYMS